MTSTEKLRNIAIIAHVDHGKTTLVDAFIKQSHTFRENQEEMQQDRILDSNDLEREKGITISAKNISLPYKGHKINIIDTPGHADFGGEVERTLNMADGCVLVIDAQEGVMPQTKFVLKKAFELGLKPIVVINKIDKKHADPERTLSRTQDLFLNLATDESQLDFKVLYAVARDGVVFNEMPEVENGDYTGLEGDTSPLLDTVISEVPAPKGEADEPFLMQVSSLDFDPHLGRYIIGKVLKGNLKIGDSIVAVNAADPEYRLSGSVKGLMVRDGLEYAEMKTVGVGELIAIAGLDEVGIGDTICSPDKVETLPLIEISPPSLKMRFEANTSPFLGKEGKYPNWKQIQARLDQEKQTNVGLKIENNNDGSYSVSGRGELHLAILIETLRREGYEFQLRKPEIITKEIDGVMMDPQEEVYLEAPEEFYSAVSQELNNRKAELINIETENGVSKLTYLMLARNLIGLRRILLTATKGNLVISNQFAKYVPYQTVEKSMRNGRMISTETGKSLAYALNAIQERGDLFITPNTEVYQGMVVGINKYENDMEVNPLKAREKSNVRMSHAEVTMINLKSPIDLTLEYAISFVAEDEILEVTPMSLRVRKKFLSKAEEYEAMKRAKKKHER